METVVVETVAKHVLLFLWVQHTQACVCAVALSTLRLKERPSRICLCVRMCAETKRRASAAPAKVQGGMEVGMFVVLERCMSGCFVRCLDVGKTKKKKKEKKK